MREHLFVSSCDGALHDTRAPDWPRHPLRANYQKTFSRIKTVAEFKATLRNGQYAWPGAYQMYFITSDGAALSFDAAKAEARQIIRAIVDKDFSGWRVVACDINYEDSDLYCDHTGEKIPAAYDDLED